MAGWGLDETGWKLMNGWILFEKCAKMSRKVVYSQKIVKDNVTVYKRTKLSKKTGLFSVKFNTKLTYLKFHNCFGLPHLKKIFKTIF